MGIEKRPRRVAGRKRGLVATPSIFVQLFAHANVAADCLSPPVTESNTLVLETVIMAAPSQKKPVSVRFVSRGPPGRVASCFWTALTGRRIADSR